MLRLPTPMRKSDISVLEAFKRPLKSVTTPTKRTYEDESFFLQVRF